MIKQSLIKILQILLPKEKPLTPEDITELKLTFKNRYHQFRLLLNANSKALEVMTEMEGALKGSVPFGMNYVRSQCTGILTNVWKIINHLDELAPGKYSELQTRFSDIQGKLSVYVHSPGSSPAGP